MTQSEVAGYIAASLVFLTFYMKTMVPLRVAGIASNVFFIVYAFLISAHPILILHLALLPLNVLRLRQMLMLIGQVQNASEGDLGIDWLKPFTTMRRAPAGTVLFRKGELATEMFYIVSGRFRVRESGIELVAGDVVGELGLMSSRRTRTATVECIEAGRMLLIGYEQVRQLYYQNPKFGFYFLQLTTRRLFENIEKLENELAARSPAAGRAASEA